MRAAVLEAPATPLVIVGDIDVADPGPGQVRVQVRSCGICHSDLGIVDGDSPSGLPVVLGHEAAGVVVEVGAGVRTLVPGDPVLLAPLAPCGHCYWCVRGEPTMCQDAMAFASGYFPDGTTPLSRGGTPVLRGLGVGGFAEQVVIAESGAVKVDEDVPLEIACVLGCAVQTGVGAVLNTAKVEEGATVLVLGLGGVGISIVQGARLAGAARIIVSDPNPARLAGAEHFGATDLLDPTAVDVIAACQDITRGIGVDYAFDAAGSAALLEAGLAATRRGGTTIGVGVPKLDQGVTINPAVLFVAFEKKLMGCLFGSANTHREVPRLLSLWRRGRLDLEGMISGRRPLSEINEGLDDVRAGRGLRTVLDIG